MKHQRHRQLYYHLFMWVSKTFKSMLALVAGLLFINKVCAQAPMLMRLAASGAGMQNETVVYFDSLATTAYDPAYDAPSLGVSPGYLSIVTSLNNIDYQVNALPALTQTILVPVKITTGTSNPYQLSASEIQNLPQGANLILHDTQNGSSHDLRNGPATYLISDTETVARFQLEIALTLFSNLALHAVPPACRASADGVLTVSAPAAGPFDFYWKDSANNIVHTSLNKTWADTFGQANGGLYRVDVNVTGTNSCALLYYSVAPSQSAQAAFTAADTIYMHGNEAVAQFYNTSANSQWYWWDFGDGMGCDSVSPAYAYMQPGTYTVTLSAGGSACPETSYFKKSITVAGGTTGLAGANEQQVQLVQCDGAWQLHFEGEAGAVDLHVSDLAGRTVYSRRLHEVRPGARVNIDGLPVNTMLLLHISGHQLQKVYKLVNAG